ncbi:MAG: hypothetical protein P9C36_08430 [Defluviicoccus sp.]|nr:hypothetical protein [Defluviicoccus sp.]MDG4592635.1 hypothetical protein [Defluviicoccus sp.]MDS4011832.1 hypothetical protein [Defluviicoccus sp.]
MLTNIAVYKQIADEAHKKMLEAQEAGCRPKPDGSAGSVLAYDPNRTSFKHAIISVVFTGMWLEALMHQLIVKRYGKERYKDYDPKSYEEKLTLLGCCDELLLGRVKKFRNARKMLVHEKAYFDDDKFTTAQSEAENAHEILTAIHVHFLTNYPDDLFLSA